MNQTTSFTSYFHPFSVLNSHLLYEFHHFLALRGLQYRVNLELRKSYLGGRNRKSVGFRLCNFSLKHISKRSIQNNIPINSIQKWTSLNFHYQIRKRAKWVKGKLTPGPTTPALWARKHKLYCKWLQANTNSSNNEKSAKFSASS